MVSAELPAASAISPSPRLPAPEVTLQPGDSRDETPAATPGVLSTPSPAPAAAPPPVAAAAATDERLVAATLRRFANAYQQLDADAVADVWPHADRRVLTRAFDSIESQQMYFENCDVQVSESGATASCGGWLTYVPKVGKKDPRSISRQWDFALQKGAGEWRITTAAVR
jgi:ketosteroid isomerase-like protein